jgi:hypothetical protein
MGGVGKLRFRYVRCRPRKYAAPSSSGGGRRHINIINCCSRVEQRSPMLHRATSPSAQLASCPRACVRAHAGSTARQRDSLAPRAPPPRRSAGEDDELDDGYDDDAADWEAQEEEAAWRRWRRRSRGGAASPPPPPPPPPSGKSGWLDGFGWQGSSVQGALTAAAFVLGIGARFCASAPPPPVTQRACAPRRWRGLRHGDARPR